MAIRISVERSWKRLRYSPKGTEFLPNQGESNKKLSDKVAVGVAEDLTQAIHHLQSTAVILDVELPRDQREEDDDVVGGDGAQSNQDRVDLRLMEKRRGTCSLDSYSLPSDVSAHRRLVQNFWTTDVNFAFLAMSRS